MDLNVLLPNLYNQCTGTSAKSSQPRVQMPRQLAVIDLTNYSERKDKIAQQLLDAASEAGFFWITGHGITQARFYTR